MADVEVLLDPGTRRFAHRSRVMTFLHNCRMARMYGGRTVLGGTGTLFELCVYSIPRGTAREQRAYRLEWY